MEKEAENHQDDIDWENRILCSDGNCIGVIGPDGCCKECGRPYEGELPDALRENKVPAETAPAETVTPPEEMTASEPEDAASDSVSDEDWENVWLSDPIPLDELKGISSRAREEYLRDLEEDEFENE